MLHKSYGKYSPTMFSDDEDHISYKDPNASPEINAGNDSTGKNVDSVGTVKWRNVDDLFGDFFNEFDILEQSQQIEQVVCHSEEFDTTQSWSSFSSQFLPCSCSNIVPVSLNNQHCSLNKKSSLDHSKCFHIDIASRPSTLFTELPHYPILVENIPSYISHPDYKCDFLKTLQTIGEIVPQQEYSAKIVTLTPNRDDAFPLSLQYLPIERLYPLKHIKKLRNARSMIWDEHVVFKTFGTLENNGGEIVLEVTDFIPVKDIKCTLKTFQIISTLAPCRYMQFGRGLNYNKQLQKYWETPGNRMKYQTS